MIYELIYDFLNFQFGTWFGISLVHAWFTNNDKKMTMTENVWSEFTYFDKWVVYKKSGICTFIWLFSFHHWYVQYQRLWEMLRNDYLWLVYNWNVAWWCMYNDLFCCDLAIAWEFSILFGRERPTFCVFFR